MSARVTKVIQIIAVEKCLITLDDSGEVKIYPQFLQLSRVSNVIVDGVNHD